jgi:hypothetical protein
MLTQYFSKNACEFFHDKADFAALTIGRFHLRAFGWQKPSL